MLSVGNRDGRKGLGFGGNMEDTELEEGEACSYQDDDPAVDPDIALAYLDEKLHSVLGHFQKDFEGGVSAENLGAKFGGYGSFLPTYQRSPIGSHPRTLSIQNHALRSPGNLQLEGGSHDITTPVIAPLRSHCPDISSARVLSSVKPLTTRDPVKLDPGMERTQAKELTLRSETFKKSTLLDQKKIKVRIRVGSDNLSSQTKAELYSGLGLHASPSSSFEDSPQSEGWSKEPHDAPDVSPNSILHIMTSFPLEGSMLLSPLAKDLAYLTGNKKIRKGRRPESVLKSETAKSISVTNGPTSSRNNGKLSVAKKKMSSKINGISLECSNSNIGDVHDVISKLSKETYDEDFPCEKQISKTSRLPLLSTSDIPVSNGKVSQVFRGSNKDAISSDASKVEPLDVFFNHGDVWADAKPTADVASAGNHRDDRKENLIGDNEPQPMKNMICNGSKSYGSSGTELNPSIEVKAVKQEIINNPTSKSDTKVGFQKQDARSISAVEDLGSSRAKSKSNMTPGDTNIAEVAKREVRDGSSSLSKLEKNVNQGSKYEAKSSKLQSNIRKSKDTYKDFFGDSNSEHEENEVESLDFPSGCALKGSQVTDNDKMSFNNSLKVKAISKKFERPVTSGSHSKTGSHAVPPMSGPSPVAPAPAAHVLIEEHWVCCDKCQKWRLLPVGRLPDSLPEKWLCSMLDWLPGMNRCDIEEEETTKALVSYYQASVASEGDKNPHSNVGGSTAREYPAVIQHPSSRVNSVASIAKKKNGLTETLIAVSSQGPADVGDPAKILQPAIKSRSLNDVKQSPSVADLDNRHLKKSSDLVVEKKKKVSTDRQKLHKHSLDGGGKGNIRTHKKRGADQDDPRTVKKHKNEDLTDEGWISESDPHVPSRYGGTNIMPFAVVAGKNRDKSSEAKSYTNHIGGEIDNSLSKKTKKRFCKSIDGSLDKINDGNGSSSKKRKANGSQESSHSESRSTAGLKAEQKKESLKAESSQRHHGKQKKARVSSHDLKASGSKRESIAERGDLAVPKELKPAQDPNGISLKQSMEDMDLSRRDLPSSHPIMEAASSSSKVSSSRKSKANLQITEGSPVESVSSSPLRSQSKDRHASNGRNDFDKECPPDFFGLSGSPKKYSDHEIDGRNGSMRHVKKDNGGMEKISAVSHKGTEVLSVLDFRDSISGGKIKGKPAACDKLSGNHIANEFSDTFFNLPCEQKASDYGLREETDNDTLYLSNGSLPDKKGSSIQSKDRMRKSNLFDSSEDQTHTCGEELVDDKVSEHTAAKTHKLEKKHDMKIPSESGKKCTQVKSRCNDGQGAKHNNFPSLSACKQNLVQEHEGTLNTLPPEKMELRETSLPRGKSVLRTPFVGGSSTDICHPGSDKGNEIDNTNVHASERDDSMKGPKLFRKADNQNGGPPTTSGRPTSVAHKAKDLNAPSPARRDSSSQSAVNAVKEAKDLKHMADRKKSSGSNAESIGLYFQASLKFLRGASLLESSTSETRHGDMIQSIQMYRSTAKLCEFCANEYEKAKDMASAALAYKCTEVAYMRVIYSSHSNANRDRHELQTALQMAPPGESPSSSASDVDNLNNAATGDKVLLAKGLSSPQVAGSHVISARNRPGFARLLNFAQDVNFAMEASRKSRVALAAVIAHTEHVHSEEGISSIKRALDFNFQDVEGLLRLIRLAVEAISR
ncbi:unnamed protein product [Rhodiola kirilowii]